MFRKIVTTIACIVGFGLVCMSSMVQAQDPETQAIAAQSNYETQNEYLTAYFTEGYATENNGVYTITGSVPTLPTIPGGLTPNQIQMANATRNQMAACIGAMEGDQSSFTNNCASAARLVTAATANMAASQWTQATTNWTGAAQCTHNAILAIADYLNQESNYSTLLQVFNAEVGN